MEEKLKNKVLAEELAEKLEDQKNIGFYYTLAGQYDHEFIRSIMYWVSDYPNPQNKGKLFTWRLKNVLSEKEIPHETLDINRNMQELKDFRKRFNSNR